MKKSKTSRGKFNCYKVEWMYHEAGWGNVPDGTSYHRTIDDAKKYIEQVELERRKRPFYLQGDYSYPSPNEVFATKVEKSMLERIGDSIGFKEEE